MSFIIFDLEWNQPVNSAKSEAFPHGEIIQIGFIALNEKLEITHREELMIRPGVYRTMNPYVSTLTGITQENIDSGLPFADAWGRMARFFAPDTALITWGDDDIPILRDNMRYHGIDTEMLPVHYNLQRIYAAQTGSKLRQTGLKTAADALGITDEVKAHDALNDAYMTYLIACRLDLAVGIEGYANFVEVTAEKQRPPWELQKPLYVVKTAFDKNPSGMCGECRRLHFTCPWCGKDFFGTEPIRQGKNSFVSVGECHCKGELFFRWSLKEGYISIAAFAMNDELEGIYKARIKSREKRESRREMFRKTARNARKAAKQGSGND